MGNKETYLNYMGIMDTLKKYASPRSKLTTMIKKGELIKVRRGLYLPGNCTWYSTKTLANIIYGPSYVSFETALSYYGIIPERVHAITSACFNKNKNKQFETPVGIFLYRYTNPTVYPYGITRINENDESFLIATPEKAVCDMLSKIRGITSVKAITELLIDDLRMDHEALLNLDTYQVKFLAGVYRKKILDLLLKFLSNEFPSTEANGQKETPPCHTQ